MLDQIGKIVRTDSFQRTTLFLPLTFIINSRCNAVAALALRSNRARLVLDHREIKRFVYPCHILPTNALFDVGQHPLCAYRSLICLLESSNTMYPLSCSKSPRRTTTPPPLASTSARKHPTSVTTAGLPGSYTTRTNI